MPLFGNKDKKKKGLERSDSWSLGSSGLKNSKDSPSDMAFEKPQNNGLPPSTVPAQNTVPPHIVEMGTGEDVPRTSEQPARPELATTESSKSFAVELDSSTISSLPPSHRDGGSISGSEPTRGPSTRATSFTSSPSDRLNQEFLAPDQSEKEAVVSKGLMPAPPVINSPDLSREVTKKDIYVANRPASSLFSLPVSTPSSISRGYREYNFYNTPNFKDLVVCDPSQRAMFYSEMSSHTRSKSDVALRDFGEELNITGTKSMSINEQDLAKTRIVAVADYVPNENAKQIKLGIGDPLDPAACVWVVMKNVYTDAVAGLEKYDMAVPGLGGKDIVFQWIKGATPDQDTGDESSGAKEAYRLVCEDGVVASFRNTSMTNVRKRGSLRVYEGPMVDEYLLLIFLSASAMSEMYRRRRCKKIRRSMLVPF